MQKPTTLQIETMNIVLGVLLLPFTFWLMVLELVVATSGFYYQQWAFTQYHMEYALASYIAYISTISSSSISLMLTTIAWIHLNWMLTAFIRDNKVNVGVSVRASVIKRQN